MLGQFDLFRLDFHFVLAPVLRQAADLVGKIHRMQRKTVVVRAHQHHVLALVHGQLGNRGPPGLFHRLDQQLVSLAPGVFRDHVIRGVEVERVYVGEVHEFLDFHGARRRGRDLLNLFVFHQHVLALLVLVSLDDLRALDHALARGTVERLTDPRLAHLVKLVESDVFGARGGEQTHRHRNQAKGKISLPDRGRHRQRSLSRPVVSCCKFTTDVAPIASDTRSTSGPGASLKTLERAKEMTASQRRK